MYLSNNVTLIKCVPALPAMNTPHLGIPCVISLLVTTSEPTLPKCHLLSEAFTMLRHLIPHMQGFCLTL